MDEPLRLMAVMAHPDDESLGIGGTLAHYAAAGVEVCVVTATRGEAGRFFDNQSRPSDAEVGRVREQELRAAARELGVRDVVMLGYPDKELDAVEPMSVVSSIVREIRRFRPQVIITFAGDGAYGHPDHIAISQWAIAAVVAAADRSFEPGASAHRVAKVYEFGWPKRIWDLYQLAFKRMVSTVDGVERQAQPWPEWMVTTRIDAGAHWRSVWRAIQNHKTQLALYRNLDTLTEEQHAILWGDQHFYRVFSLVNGGRKVETDLFAGLR